MSPMSGDGDTGVADYDAADQPSLKEVAVAADLQPTHEMSAFQMLTIGALTMSYIGSQVDSFFGAPGLNYIAFGLNIGIERSWISVSSSLATACIAPVSGYIQDIIGRKSSLILSLALAIIGPIVCGTAHGFAQLIVGNIIIGLGSGMQELVALAAIAELVPTKRRGLFFGVLTFSTIIFGPSYIYASELSLHASWRWLYFIPVIWNVVAAILAAVTYLPMTLKPHEKPESRLELLKSLDYLGMLLLVAGTTEILIALQSPGSGHSWNSAYFISQLVVGVALIGLLVLWESFGFGHPLIPFRLFKGQRVIGITFIICFFSGILYTPILALGPTILQEVFQKSPLETGLLTLGAAWGLTIGATSTNIGLSVFNGRARELLLVSAIIMTAFIGAQSCISPSRDALFAVLTTFGSLGVGAVLVPLSTIVTIACPQDLIGTAVSLVISLRTIGGSVGYAIYFTLYMNNVATKGATLIGENVLQAGLPPDKVTALVTTFLESLDPVSPTLGSNITSNPTILAAAHHGHEQAAAEAAQVVLYGSIPVAVIVILATLCLPNLKKFLNNDTVAMPDSRKASFKSNTV